MTTKEKFLQDLITLYTEQYEIEDLTTASITLIYSLALRTDRTPRQVAEVLANSTNDEEWEKVLNAQ